MSEWFPRVFSEIAQHLQQSQNPPLGPPYARYHRLDQGRFHVEAGFPVGRPIVGSGEIHPSSLPEGPVAVISHIGPYDEMEPAYQALHSWIDEHHAQAAGDAWEVYFSGPEEPPGEWRTEIHQPYREPADIGSR
jgi:effector-binding domain-containing protein